MASLFNRRPAELPQQEIPKPPALPSQPGFDTVLGAECAMEGKLTSGGNIRLDGAFAGTLEITGNVLVGETAKIKADIHARNISIAGHVQGNVSGHKVQILRTGHIIGDISATSITAEEGAYIEGKITMVRHETPKPVVTELPIDETQPTNQDDETPEPTE